MGSKCTYLCTPNSPKVSLEKDIFDPFVTPFWSQKTTSSCPCNGLKKGSFHLFVHPKWSRIIFWKQTFWTHFWSQNIRFSRHFVTLQGPKWLPMGSKWAHFTCLGTPNGLGSFLEKHIFDPFLTHFWAHNNPFWEFSRVPTGHHGLRTHQKHLFSHSMWSKIIFGESHFFCTRWTLLTHFGTHLFGLPLAACRSPLGLGTGV